MNMMWSFIDQYFLFHLKSHCLDYWNSSSFSSAGCFWDASRTPQCVVFCWFQALRFAVRWINGCTVALCPNFSPSKQKNLTNSSFFLTTAVHWKDFNMFWKISSSMLQLRQVLEPPRLITQWKKMLCLQTVMWSTCYTNQRYVDQYECFCQLCTTPVRF